MFLLTIYETKNDDEPNGRDTQTEDDDLGIESDAEKGDDIKFDNIDHVQEKEDGLDNCVYHQIENNLEEKSYMNKELIFSRELEESEVQIEHRDVLDANLVEHECTDSVSTTESENPIVDCETSGQKDNTLDEERFLYRLLKPGESWNSTKKRQFEHNHRLSRCLRIRRFRGVKVHILLKNTQWN